MAKITVKQIENTEVIEVMTPYDFEDSTDINDRVVLA